MKRTLSFLLALVMVLGTFTTVFAAEPTVEEAAGALLQELDVLRGKGDGLLHLEDDLRREEAVVLLSRLMGVEEVAEEFPTEGLPFEDVKDAYFKTFVAWAYANKLTDGKSATKFGFNDPLTAQQYATFLLRALEYEPDYATALETAKELGLLADVEVVNSTVVKRGVMAVMTVNALGTKVNGSEETLAAKLGLEMPVEEPTLSTDIEVTAVAAIANNKVEVKVKEEVAASVADFAIVKKGTTTAVEVKDVVKESAKVFVLETEALVGGTSYTLTSNGKTLNFTGLAADTTAPTVVKVSATDTNTFVVEYSDRMDFATATNVENYTFNKGIKVVNAKLNADRTKVTLTTDAAKRNTVYTFTIQNVLNSDLKAIAKVSRTVTAFEDRIAPRVTTLKVQNNRMLEVKFQDTKGMDQASIETLENYKINDLDIISAKGYKDADGLYDTVILMTEEQTANKAYTLTMENLTDASVLANPLGKTSRAFRGATADKTSPTVKPGSIASENNNLVDIEFNDNNAMDVASLENIENYVITYGNNEILPILGAEAWYTTYPNAYKYKGVTLTTAQQEIGTNYKLEVKGVEDEFGNALKPISGSTYAKYNFQGTKVDTQPPYVTKVEYVDSTRVILHFDNAVTNATDPTSYVIDKNIGAAIKARVIAGTSNKQVELTTQSLTDNVTYTITINNVEDRFGNALSNVKVKFVATASALDVTAPSMTYIYAANDQEIHVNLNERVTAQPSSIVVKKVDANGEFTTDPIIFNYSGKINGATTVVYKSTNKLASANYKIETMTGNAFTDVAGNKLVGYATATVPAVDTRDVFYGNGVSNAAPEVEYIEQINTKTLKVVFNEPVSGSAPTGYTLDNDPTYDTHLTEWYLVKATNFVVGQELTLNFSGMKDLADLGSTDTAYKFTPYLEDTTKPMIVGVEATNNKEVVVEYSEDLSTSGTYRIYYIDAKNNSIHVFTGGGVVDDNTVILTLNNALKGENIYYIDLLSGATDIAGNREDVSGVRFDFPGTDVNVTDFITGVAINNAKKVTVSATKAISGATVYELDANGNRVLKLDNAVTVNGTAKLSATVTLDVPVLAGVKYEVEVAFVQGSPEKYRFNGITPDTGIELTRINSTTVELNWSGFNSDLYKYGVYTVPAASATAKVTITPSTNPVTELDVVFTDVDADNPFDGTLRFTGAASSYYIVLFDAVDTTRVIFAAKVNVVNSPSYEEAVGNRPNYTINFATSETNEPIEATDFTSTDGTTWTAGNGLKLPLTPGTTVYFAKSNTPAIDEIQTLVVPPVPVGPVFTIDYLAGTTKEVVPTTVEYSTDGTTWTAGTGVVLALTPGTDVDFRTKATASAFESATETLVVKAAPSATTYTVTADGKTNALIPNTVEYKVGAGEWTTGASAAVNLPIGTAVQFRTRATATDFAGAVQTLTAAYAAAPTTVALAAGTTNGATVTTDVTLPAVGETNATGKVTGWATGTADAIKFTVTDAAGATSTITINGTSYTSGADYTIAATGTLTIVVTTTQSGAVTAVRTFTVVVE